MTGGGLFLVNANAFAAFGDGFPIALAGLLLAGLLLAGLLLAGLLSMRGARGPASGSADGIRWEDAPVLATAVRG